MTKVDTAALTSAAASIRATNARIANAFDTLQNKASVMDAAWDGSAAQNAMTAFNRLKSLYPQPRFNALESAARVLDAIASGYNCTEEKNTSLAAQFK